MFIKIKDSISQWLSILLQVLKFAIVGYKEQARHDILRRINLKLQIPHMNLSPWPVSPNPCLLDFLVPLSRHRPPFPLPTIANFQVSTEMRTYTSASVSAIRSLLKS